MTGVGNVWRDLKNFVPQAISPLSRCTALFPVRRRQLLAPHRKEERMSKTKIKECPLCKSGNIGTVNNYNIPHCADCDTNEYEWINEVSQERLRDAETLIGKLKSPACPWSAVEELIATYETKYNVKL